MVNGRQYSLIDAGASIAEMESETDSRPRHITVTSFNHRRRTRQRRTASERQVGRGMAPARIRFGVRDFEITDFKHGFPDFGYDF